jgi:hypothetical protein
VPEDYQDKDPETRKSAPMIYACPVADVDRVSRNEIYFPHSQSRRLAGRSRKRAIADGNAAAPASLPRDESPSEKVLTKNSR